MAAQTVSESFLDSDVAWVDPALFPPRMVVSRKIKDTVFDATNCSPSSRATEAKDSTRKNRKWIPGGEWTEALVEVIWIQMTERTFP